VSVLKSPQDSVTISIKVVPRASKSQIAGWEEDVLKVRLQAPPVEGKANAALIEFLAAALGVPRAFVDIVAGETSRRKLVRIRGMTAGRLKTLIPEK
jgi:hypothetical protein